MASQINFLYVINAFIVLIIICNYFMNFITLLLKTYFELVVGNCTISNTVTVTHLE